MSNPRFNAIEYATGLYDGGWRSEDIEEIASEYGLSVNETSLVMSALVELESDTA